VHSDSQKNCIVLVFSQKIKMDFRRVKGKPASADFRICVARRPFSGNMAAPLAAVGLRSTPVQLCALHHAGNILRCVLWLSLPMK